LLTYSAATKTDMVPEGFVMDTYTHFNPSISMNTGFLQRRELFIESKEHLKPDKWKKDPVPFWGVLSTDFDTARDGNPDLIISFFDF
jgi:hypothetical protein